LTQHTYSGGANVGWLRTGWPCARLTVSGESLRFAGLGDFCFARADVIALEPIGWVPFFHRGFRIRHRRADCPEKIIFWPARSRTRILAEIAALGFAPLASR